MTARNSTDYGKPERSGLDEYIQYMDAARLIPTVQTQKRHILDLMQLQTGHHALDIGCGTGDDVRELAEVVDDTGRVIGIDLSEGMIAEARRRSTQSSLPVEFQTGNIYQLEFAEDSFDAVRAERLFEHLLAPREALAEMIRVTRKGGRIVVASPDMDSNTLAIPERTITRKITHFECDRRPNGWAGRQLYGMFVEAGLTDVEPRAITHIDTDYSIAIEALGIGKRAELAREAGVISADEASAWLDELMRVGEAGGFFMSVTYFIVAGRKPGSTTALR